MYGSANGMCTVDGQLVALQGEPQPIEVELIDDGDYFPGKYKTTFSIKLRPLDTALAVTSRLSVGPVSEAHVTIINTNARTGTIRLVEEMVIVDEDQGTLLLNLTRSGGADCDATVSYRTVAIPGADFGHYGAEHPFQAGKVLWAEGDATVKTISLPIIDNSEIQPGTETFFVELYDAGCASFDLGAPSPGVRTKVVVVDDEDVGTLVVESKHITVRSIDGEVDVSVRRVGGSARSISVDYNVVAGTGEPGRDFAPVSGYLVWRSGQSGLRNLRVQLLNDTSTTTVLQRDFTVRFQYVIGTTIDADEVRVTVLNAYAMPGKIGFSSMAACRNPLPLQSDLCVTHREGETAVLKLIRTEGYAGSLKIVYRVENLTRTGNDNVGVTSGTVKWEDQDGTPKFIYVPLLFDSDPRPLLDHVVVILEDSEPLAPVVDKQRSKAYISIMDQDGGGSFSIQAANATFFESDGYVQLLVYRHGKVCLSALHAFIYGIFYPL